MTNDRDAAGGSSSGAAAHSSSTVAGHSSSSPAGDAPSAARSARLLRPLLAGNFVIGTGVMAVPGTLNEISSSLAVSVATAGQLITAGAALMCFGAPLFAALVAGWDRRRLLTLSMLWFALAHFACALAPDFAWLLPLRVLALVPPAIFTPQAAACLGLLVPAEQRGRAITFIFLGWSLASVLGMPIAALAGGWFGWRSAFAMVGVLGLASAAWVWHTMPDGVKPPPLSLAAWKQAFSSPALMACVLVTMLFAAGQFVQFSYITPYFKHMLDASPTQLGLYFMWFGAFGLLGNVVMSRTIDRVGTERAVTIGIVLMATSLLLFPLGVTWTLAALLSVPWALGCFSSNSAQQARLVALAPSLAAASVALNSSAMYAGQAIGAASGGWLIARGGMETLHWAAFAGLLAALVMSALATHYARRRAT